MATGHTQGNTSGLVPLELLCVKIRLSGPFSQALPASHPGLGGLGLAVLTEDLHSLNTLRVMRYF